MATSPTRDVTVVLMVELIVASMASEKFSGSVTMQATLLFIKRFKASSLVALWRLNMGTVLFS